MTGSFLDRGVPEVAQLQVLLRDLGLSTGTFEVLQLELVAVELEP